MKPITLEWVAKAEGDFAMLERESRARKNPNYDGICFHAQQCAEKYIKARLCEAGIEFKKIHDLVSLLDKVLGVEPMWETFRQHLAYLSGFAVFAIPVNPLTKPWRWMPVSAAGSFAVQPVKHLG